MLSHGLWLHYRPGPAARNGIQTIPRRFLEVIAVDQADRIQAFVVVGEAGVRHVIEPKRQ